MVLGAFGSVIAAGGQWLVNVFPIAGVAVSVAMTIAGIFLVVTHRTLGINAAGQVVGRVGFSPQRNMRNIFVYGIVYAIGTLSCTLPIFLVVVGSSLATDGVLASFIQFIGYALGMGSVLIAVTLGAALFRGTVARWLRKAMPLVHRTSALFLVGAGLYLV